VSTPVGVAGPPAAIEDRLRRAGLPPLPRLAWLEIDLLALEANAAAVRERVGPHVAIAPVIKADAYGHGVSAAVAAFGPHAAMFCVATLDEAQVVRTLDARPILVLFAPPPEEMAEAAGELRIEAVASDPDALRALLAAWLERGRRGTLRIHVEVETGLHRGGLHPDEVVEAVASIGGVARAEVAGLWTHLARAEAPVAVVEQAERFARAVAALRAAGSPVPPRHVVATGGLLGPDALLPDGGGLGELVRPGLCLYGERPDDVAVAPEAERFAAALRPAMTLKARAVRFERIAGGVPVGYGGRWTSDRPSRVATLPLGYADGWPRASHPGAQALVRGRRVPLVGSVAMDAVIADVTDVPEADWSDEFVLLGSQGEDTITAGELARLRTTIPWEVLATMADRLPRVYHAGAVVRGLRTLRGERAADPVGP
jgi:alanine racemase